MEAEIARVAGQLTDPKLRWMFINCFPNTLDTTVHYREDEDGTPVTFVYTGDIHAMWLRDSGAQVWPYVAFANEDESLRKMIAGVINTQFKLICIDPYANAFNDGPSGGEWMSDLTDMNPHVHERKWEIDSDCYPIRLAYWYWQVTGDSSIFGDIWMEAIQNILLTFHEQQRKDGRGPYHFFRMTDRTYDTVGWQGYGAPVKPVGLIASAFRPSDDATTLPFLVPSNFFAVDILRKAAEIVKATGGDSALAADATALADEVSAALAKYAVADTEEWGRVYAFEVDGFGGRVLMDDANAPSLLSLPHLCGIDRNDPVYVNTRRMILSSDGNPYYFKGRALEGIGSPHTGIGQVWPMSVIMRILTSDCEEEQRAALKMLVATTAGTGFMHESVDADDPAKFSRSWFAWANTLFGEAVLEMAEKGMLK